MSVAAFAYTKILTGQYTQQVQSSVRRTQMSDGLAKQAKRYSKTYVRHNMVYLMTSAQYVSFLTWWENTANYGIEYFDFYNPQTGATEDGRIVGGDFTTSPFDSQLGHYAISMQVETLL